MSEINARLGDVDPELFRAEAHRIVDWIDGAPDFERLAPVPFSTVNFRYRPARLADHSPGAEAELDRLNEQLEERVNATGKVFITHTRIRGRYALHVAVGNLHTTEAHRATLWCLLRAHADH